MWRIVFSRASMLSLGFRRATSSMIYKMLGIEPRLPRWRECLNYTKELFAEALELLFAREKSSKREKVKVG